MYGKVAPNILDEIQHTGFNDDRLSVELLSKKGNKVESYGLFVCDNMIGNIIMTRSFIKDNILIPHGQKLRLTRDFVSRSIFTAHLDEIDPHYMGYGLLSRLTAKTELLFLDDKRDKDILRLSPVPTKKNTKDWSFNKWQSYLVEKGVGISNIWRAEDDAIYSKYSLERRIWAERLPLVQPFQIKR